MSDNENENNNIEAKEKIISALGQIKFGAIEVHIHNGRVVQIEEKTKTRF